jgi:hypothetical protein
MLSFGPADDTAREPPFMESLGRLGPRLPTFRDRRALELGDDVIGNTAQRPSRSTLAKAPVDLAARRQQERAPRVLPKRNIA